VKTYQYKPGEATVLTMTRMTIGVLLFVVLLSLAGCSAKSNLDAFLRQEIALDYFKTVAVLPFENHTTDPNAAARCREILLTEVMAAGLFEVVEKGQVDSRLRAEAIDLGTPIDTAMLRRLGQRLGVQGLLMGSVDTVGESRIGNSVYPELSMSMRLVDTESGLVVWQASGRGTGYSLWGRLFGVGFKDSFQVTLELIRTMLATMGEKAAPQGLQKKRVSPQAIEEQASP
jgi:TolB-like protein